MPTKRRLRPKRNHWLTALMVVEFDVDSAHKPLVCLPADAVSDLSSRCQALRSSALAGGGTVAVPDRLELAALASVFPRPPRPLAHTLTTHCAAF